MNDETQQESFETMLARVEHRTYGAAFVVLPEGKYTKNELLSFMAEMDDMARRLGAAMEETK